MSHSMKKFFNLYDVVSLVKPYGRFCQGAIGTIVERLNQETYLVEFCDKKGRTLDLVPLEGNEISKLRKDQALVAA